jgi:hypothetical protein
LILSWLFGIVGTCWAVLACEATLLGSWIVYLANRQYTLNFRNLLFKSLVAGLAMAGTIYLLRPQAALPLFAVSSLAILVYALTLFKLRIFSDEETRLAREALVFVKPFIVEWTSRSRTEVAKEV